MRVGSDDGDDLGAVRSGVVAVGLRVAGGVDEYARAFAEDSLGKAGRAVVLKLFDFYEKPKQEWKIKQWVNRL